MVRAGMVLLMCLAMGACEAQPKPPVVAEEGALYVPSSMLVAGGAGTGINPYQVLPESDTLYDFIGREDKFVYGGIPLYAASAWSVYTYDWQRITTPGGSGYRYSTSVREGASSP